MVTKAMDATTTTTTTKAMDATLYDAHSLAQASLHTLAAPMLRSAAESAGKAAVANGDPCIGLLIVGPATGANDIAAIKKDVLPALKMYAPALPIRALFADLESNEWDRLLPEMNKLLEDGVTSSATIGLAKDVVTAPASIHLAISFSTLHWIHLTSCVRSGSGSNTVCLLRLLGFARPC